MGESAPVAVLGDGHALKTGETAVLRSPNSNGAAVAASGATLGSAGNGAAKSLGRHDHGHESSDEDIPLSKRRLQLAPGRPHDQKESFRGATGPSHERKQDLLRPDAIFSTKAGIGKGISLADSSSEDASEEEARDGREDGGGFSEHDANADDDVEGDSAPTARRRAPADAFNSTPWEERLTREETPGSEADDSVASSRGGGEMTARGAHDAPEAESGDAPATPMFRSAPAPACWRTIGARGVFRRPGTGGDAPTRYQAAMWIKGQFRTVGERSPAAGGFETVTEAAEAWDRAMVRSSYYPTAEIAQCLNDDAFAAAAMRAMQAAKAAGGAEPVSQCPARKAGNVQQTVGTPTREDEGSTVWGAGPEPPAGAGLQPPGESGGSPKTAAPASQVQEDNLLSLTTPDRATAREAPGPWAGVRVSEAVRLEALVGNAWHDVQVVGLERRARGKLRVVSRDFPEAGEALVRPKHVRRQSTPFGWAPTGRPKVGDLVLAVRHEARSRIFKDALIVDIARVHPRARANYPARAYPATRVLETQDNETPERAARRLGLCEHALVRENREEYPGLTAKSRLRAWTALALPPPPTWEAVDGSVGGGEDGRESGLIGEGSPHWDLEYLVQYVHGGQEVYGCLEWLRPEHVFCVHPGSVTIHVPAPHDVAMDSSYHGGGGFASGKSAPSVLGSPCSKQQHHENPTSARLTAVTDILRRSGVPMNPHALAEQALAEGSITFSGMGTAGDSMKAFLNKVIRDGRCRSLVNLGGSRFALKEWEGPETLSLAPEQKDKAAPTPTLCPSSNPVLSPPALGAHTTPAKTEATSEAAASKPRRLATPRTVLSGLGEGPTKAEMLMSIDPTMFQGAGGAFSSQPHSRFDPRAAGADAALWSTDRVRDTAGGEVLRSVVLGAVEPRCNLTRTQVPLTLDDVRRMRTAPARGNCLTAGKELTYSSSAVGRGGRWPPGLRDILRPPEKASAGKRFASGGAAGGEAGGERKRVRFSGKEGKAEREGRDDRQRATRKRDRRERDGPLGGGFSRERQRVGEKHPDRLRRSEAERGEVRRRKDVYGRGRDGEQEWRTKELGTVYFLERSAVVARELAELARIEAGEPGDDDEEDEEEDEDDEGPAIPPPPTLLTSAAAAGLALVSALPSCAFKKTFNAKAQEAWARDVAESPFLQLRARISELEAEIHESIWCQGYAEEVRPRLVSALARVDSDSLLREAVKTMARCICPRIFFAADPANPSHAGAQAAGSTGGTAHAQSRARRTLSQPNKFRAAAGTRYANR